MAVTIYNRIFGIVLSLLRHMTARAKASALTRSVLPSTLPLIVKILVRTELDIWSLKPAFPVAFSNALFSFFKERGQVQCQTILRAFVVQQFS